MQNELKHYGILGMKWGRRKASSGSARGKPKTLSDDAKEAATIKKKSVGEMSNAELRKLNDRKQLEKQYSTLNPSIVKKGLAIVTSSAAILGTAMSVYNNSSQAVKIGKNIVNKIVKK